MKLTDPPSLEKALPEGQLVNRAWLKARGFDRPRVDSFVRSEKLVSVAHGVYRRPGPPLKWEQVVYSLNQMGLNVHVGGYSALEQAGLAHWVRISEIQEVDLYVSSKVPAWLAALSYDPLFESSSFKNASKYRFRLNVRLLFQKFPFAAIANKPFGAWDWPVPHATPELALLEMLQALQDDAGFYKADDVFEAATMLRPDLLNELLLSCKSVKVKRLFFWFGARHEHLWFKELKRDEINLGSGKRVLVHEGKLDGEYQITVPKDMVRGNEPPLY